MKKSKILLSVLLIGMIVSISFAWKNIESRSYKIEIPENEIQSYWAVIHGNQDNLTVGQYKSIMTILESQVLAQAKNFHEQDSLMAIKNKKDTTNKK